MDDRQTHDLPAGAEERARLAYALRAADWDELYARLGARRAVVEAQFDKIAWEAEGRGGRQAADPAGAAWESGDVAGLMRIKAATPPPADAGGGTAGELDSGSASESGMKPRGSAAAAPSRPKSFR